MGSRSSSASTPSNGGAHVTVCQLTKRRGHFYFSVPIAEVQRFEFDAHRIFSMPYLLAMFRENDLLLDSFSYVDDAGALHMDIGPDFVAEAKRSFQWHFGCSIFELRKSA